MDQKTHGKFLFRQESYGRDVRRGNSPAWGSSNDAVHNILFLPSGFSRDVRRMVVFSARKTKRGPSELSDAGAACAALRLYVTDANEELTEFLESGILFLDLV